MTGSCPPGALALLLRRDQIVADEDAVILDAAGDAVGALARRVAKAGNGRGCAEVDDDPMRICRDRSDSFRGARAV